MYNEEYFPLPMTNLHEEVREKAIDIANELIKDGYSYEIAIPTAIHMALDWGKNYNITTVN